MKVGVVGAGAMGSLFGGYLANAGHGVWLVDTWAEHVGAIRERGLRIVEPGGEERLVRPHAVTDPGEVGPCDLVLVFVKAYHTRAVAAALPRLMGPESTVLTLQNGLGNADILAEAVPASSIVVGTTGQAANVLGPGSIHHAGTGATYLGEWQGGLTERLRRVARMLEDAGLPAVVQENVHGLIWAKLLVNVAVNALTAILRVRNGQLLDIPEAVELMKQAVGEAVMVAFHRGVQLPLEDPWKHVEDVVRRTAANRSSMLQDVESGRPTEVDFINGAIVREAARCHLCVPVNATLTSLVKGVERLAQRK